MVISEQYSPKAHGQWFEDESKRADIWIPKNKSMRPGNGGTGNGYMWTQFFDIMIMSCNLTPNDPIGEFQTKLNTIEDTARNIYVTQIISAVR